MRIHHILRIQRGTVCRPVFRSPRRSRRGLDIAAYFWRAWSSLRVLAPCSVGPSLAEPSRQRRSDCSDVTGYIRKKFNKDCICGSTRAHHTSVWTISTTHSRQMSSLLAASGEEIPPPPKNDRQDPGQSQIACGSGAGLNRAPWSPRRYVGVGHSPTFQVALALPGCWAGT
ncbi:hypothetical protein VTK26DRAFT_7102 [Humicola hyalothermophila]